MPFENVANLLRSDQTLTWRPAPRCPRCHQMFSSAFVPRSGVPSRRAFILRCDHLLCEKCVHEQLRPVANSPVKTTGVPCRVCNIRTLLDPLRPVSEQLQQSLHMTGLVYQWQHEQSRIKSGPGSSSSSSFGAAPGEESRRSIAPLEEPDENRECYECNSSRTRHYCEGCDTPLCRDCFEKIHRVGKALAKHKLRPLDTKRWLREDSSVCDEHRLATGLFCTSCEVRVCTTCRNENHALHFCVALQDINKEVQPRLDKMLQDLNKAVAMNEQGQKFTEHVLDQQREYTAATIRQITDYFMSLHSVLQSAEQELLTTVKKNYVQLHDGTVAVQKELRVAERELHRSIEQLSAYQEKPPSQTLLSDHIREMKKALAKVHVTVQYGEPRENPFCFREREPLRKEIHNFFELKCDPNAYHTKMLTFYEPQPFPVLEPINSPELEHAPPQEEPPSRLNQSSSSTIRTLKDMDISNHSASPAPATKELTPDDAREAARDHLSFASGGSADQRIKNTSKKNHKKSSSTTKNVEQLVVDETSQQSATSRRDHSQKFGQSKRAFGGRLKSYGSSGSSGHHHHNPHRKSRSTPSTDDRRLAKVPELNPANPTNANFLRLTDKVCVTCIQTPARFFVQYEKFSPKNMTEMCKLEAESEEPPQQIRTGALYLAQLAEDWHRVRVVKSRQHGRKYDVFFVDYGRTEEVPKDSLRTLSEEVATIAPGAEECALYDLAPADEGGKWSPEAKQIMVDFIDNKQVRMYLVQHDNGGRPGPMQVDLFVQTVDGYKSLRGTLVYLKLAKPGGGSGQTRRSQSEEAKIKQLQTILDDWVNEYRTQIRQRDGELVRDDVFRAKLTHSHSPSEFYVRKNSWQEKYAALEQQLAEYCKRAESRLAYLPHKKMVCAFEERDVDDAVVWKRGRIERVGEAHCEIFSVDTGHRQVVPWQDIRYLPQQLCHEPAFAVRCALMDVHPFKQHGYRWTDEAKRYFNRTASSSYVFQVIVGDRLPEEDCYKVVLNIVMKRHDTCVNALMVKEGFAVSSGPESVVVERIKEGIPEEEEEQKSVDDATAANRTLGSRSANSEGQRATSRQAVSILRLVNPGEFYVTLLKHATGIARMQEEIQNIMEDKEPGDKTDWNVGEYCLVFPTTVSKHPEENGQIACEYYRAQVVELVDDSNYTVFLIDKAITMNVHYSNMAVIAAGLKQIYPAAIRCFLACVGPTGNQTTWSSSVVDAFKVTCSKFKRFSISLHGTRVHGALPVILWGMTEEKVKALSPQMYLYTNINNRLGQYGYVHLKEKFKPLAEAVSIEEELQRHHQSFDKFLEELDFDMKEDKSDQQKQQEDDSLQHSCGNYQDDITDEHTPIDRWPPAKPIDKTIFVGKPSYVDNNGVIYLHDMEQEPVLTALRKVINAKFADSTATDKFYSDNEPCMAKFHQDNKFYRAVIRKAISCRRYKVQFIDYGNIEEVDIADLRKNVICGRVPVQMNRYRLTNVAPKDGNTWPTDVLDTLHSLIVDKQCQVRVDTDMDTDMAGVVPCFMKTTGVVCVDVSEYLLEKDMVVKKFAVALEEKVDQLYDPYMNLQGSGRKEMAPSRGVLKIGANFGMDIMSTESGESGHQRAGNFSQKELDDLFQHVAAEQSRIDNAELEDGEDSDDELNRVHYFDTYDNIKQEFDSAEEADSIGLSPRGGGTGEIDRNDETTRISFDPNDFDTSTQIDPPLEITRPTEHGFPQFEVDESVKGFYCEVTNLADTFNLFVFPQMDDHIQRMKELMAKIQCYARKHRKCIDIEEDMPCLALFKADHFWYRGVIKEYVQGTGQVQIFYVDYLNTETVNVRDILKCPVNLRRVPLRNVQIRLHGIRGNPRMRDADIRRKLVELIEGKRLYAKVTRHKPVLEVELFTDSKCTNLVYHRLIREKYFMVKEPSVPTTAAFAALRRRDK